MVNIFNNINKLTESQQRNDILSCRFFRWAFHKHIDCFQQLSPAEIQPLLSKPFPCITSWKKMNRLQSIEFGL